MKKAALNRIGNGFSNKISLTNAKTPISQTWWLFLPVPE